MSYSVAKQIEACPRRYGLERGEYDGIGAGYPRPFVWAALRGVVLHGALERFAEAYREASEESDDDARTATALERVGGLTALAKAVADEALSDLARNPRCGGALSGARARLARDTPSIRGELQSRVQSLRLPSSAAPRPGTGASSHATGSLSKGAYPELLVRAPSIGWKGVLDMLLIGNERTVILEFKTGVRRPEHEEQLRAYAVIWGLEPRNESGTPPDELTLIYPDGRVGVRPLSPEECREGARILAERKAAADAALRGVPRANVDSEHCRWCGVRHLCADYWAALDKLSLVADQGFVDLEVEVKAERGPGVFEVKVLRAPEGIAGRLASMVFAPGAQQRPGTRLRVLGGRWTESEREGELPHATVGSQAECFLLH
jgi:hypothetical protein